MYTKPKPVNSNNFLRFYEVGTDLSESKYTSMLTNGYLHRWRQTSPKLPALTGDILTFYTNFSIYPLIETDVWRIIDNEDNIITATDNHLLVVTAFGENSFKLTLTIQPTNTLDNVDRRIAIVSNTGVIKYTSNIISVRAFNERTVTNTHLLSFWHDTDIYEYEWSQKQDFDEPYTVRIPSSITGISYPENASIYKSATSGKPRRTRAILDKIVSFQTYYFDEEAHDAFAVASASEEFYLNGNKMIRDGDYEIGYNQIHNLSHGTSKFYDRQFSIRIDRCEEFITPVPPPAPTITITMEQFSEDPKFIDCNLRLVVNDVVIDELFTNGTAEYTLMDGDEVLVLWSFLADNIAGSPINPSLNAIVTQDAEVLLSQTNLIDPTTIDNSYSYTFNVYAGSVYTATAISFENTGT